jgi:uncharacterized protein YlaI
MRLTIPEGMAPAAVHDATCKQYLCRDCADRVDRVVLIDDDTYVCADCGESITNSDVPPSRTELATRSLHHLFGDVPGQDRSTSGSGGTGART